jgi:hypothetical protein
MASPSTAQAIWQCGKTAVRFVCTVALGNSMLSIKFLALSCCLLTAALATSAAIAAEELRLRDGISFYQDIDVGFPIIADKMEDLKPEPGRPTFIFFGASGDLNTSRQARRVVDLYRQYKAAGMKFLIVDVDQFSNPATKDLLKKHYTGAIPCEVILSPEGAQLWSQIGEVDARVLQTKIDSALAAK